MMNIERCDHCDCKIVMSPIGYIHSNNKMEHGVMARNSTLVDEEDWCPCVQAQTKKQKVFV